MSANSCSEAVYNEDLGCWVVPNGTAFRAFYELQEIKQGPAGGPTGTLAYSDYPVVYQTGTGTHHDFDVFTLLGNNGRLTVNPATGIQLTKHVDVVEAGTSTDNFSFTILLTNAGSPVAGPVSLIRNGQTSSLELTDGKANIVLADGDTVYITGLPANTDYTITENSHDAYTVKGVTINGATANVTAGAVSGSVADKEVDQVEFTNTLKGEGHLAISKTVEHPFGADYTAHLNKEFPVSVTLTQNGAPYAGQAVTTTLGTQTTDDAGKLHFSVKHGDAVAISDLPEGVSYAVAEDLSNFPGFRLTTTALSGTIANDATASVALVNVYEPASVEPVNVTIDGEKILVGRQWLDGDVFSFQLQRWDGYNWVDLPGAVDTATKADPEFSLTQYMQAQTFEKAGNYYFRVIEVQPSEGENRYGITYDSTFREFVVTVTGGDMTGKLVIADVAVRDWVTVNNTNGTFALWMDFTNRYAPEGSASIELTGDKALINNTGVEMTKEGFTFVLYNEDHEKVAEAVTDVSGKATIRMVYTPSLLDPTAEDDHRLTELVINYTLEEMDGGTAGMDYSNAVYHVKVTITDNLDGTISATAEMSDAEGNPVREASFENTYDLGSVDATVEGTKTLTGKDFAAGDFTFELYKASEGVIVPTSGYPKTVSNGAPANGTAGFSFTETFTKVGVYEYIIKEAIPDGHVNNHYKGVQYDDSTYLVTITVTDNGEGGLDKNVVITGGAVSFTNSYSATDASVTLGGSKNYNGQITDGQFYFELYETDANYENAVLVGQKVANVGNAFTFPTITYAGGDMSDHYYIIKEFIPDTAKNNIYDGVFYDASEYRVKVTITDNGEGARVATPAYTVGGETADAVVFTNKVIDGDSVTIRGTKKLTGKDFAAGDFSFQIYKANATFNIVSAEGYPKTVTNGAPENGVADFSFTEHFMEEGTYRFVIKEVLPETPDFIENGIAYDTTTFNVVVTVGYNGNGDLHATYVIQNGPAEFENVYSTRGEAPYVIGGTKTHDREFADDSYYFQLWAADENYQITGTEPLQTAPNKGSLFTFSKLSYTAADTYYYVIREQLPAGGAVAEGDTVYDTKEYRLSVVVTDNGDGTLTVGIPTITTADSAEAVENITFGNKLITPNSVDISATKVLENRDLTEGEFTFILKLDGQEVARTTNAADGSILFADVALDSIGEYVFTVEELEGEDKHIVYSEEVYTVTVTTTYDDNGGLIVSDPVITMDGEGKEAAVFTNTYKQPDTPVTGDEFQLALIITLMTISVLGMGAVLILGRKKNAQ